MNATACQQTGMARQPGGPWSDAIRWHRRCWAVGCPKCLLHRAATACQQTYHGLAAWVLWNHALALAHSRTSHA